ncbi:adenine phosphoribosyltransferase Apt [Peptoclostridium acidaminophilum DSM 3953]|uniref:Adenine phosphoribosyltransferase n=1 Tax=Peptoclostridium acidaminophilum DSM 3953 TaxID=1286171 RepID=W8T3D3_PEPAC|nr:adenine phosphoribosyltransferase [Peptoclostridium acidaminophilum]AHM56274.1 adenine phosphoribosyltransferase Apt [Peptoclostridium acidaminophilum DSM 3953]
MDLKEAIREVEGFPKEGINFKDITPLLKDGKAFRNAIDAIVNNIKNKDIDIVVGPEARGFLLGAPVAYAIGAGFVPVRKPGKLPWETESYDYDLEYGEDSLEIHKDAIHPGTKVAIVDDLLATGGTTKAVIELIEKLGGEVVAVEYLIELEFLNARELLKGYAVDSVIKYND